MVFLVVRLFFFEVQAFPVDEVFTAAHGVSTPLKVMPDLEGKGLDYIPEGYTIEKHPVLWPSTDMYYSFEIRYFLYIEH